MRKSHFLDFLKYFPGENTFQVFGDKANLTPMVLQNPDPRYLIKLNSKGYGIFMTINKTDGKGRSKKNITEVRAVFADLDGAPLSPALDDLPNLVVESSPGKYHCYWFIGIGDNGSILPLEAFRQVQKAIAHKYKSDATVCDLGRVLRVPGFYHLKGDPHPVQIVYEDPERKTITFAESVQKWPPVPAKKWSSKKAKKEQNSNGIDVPDSIPELLARFGWKYAHANHWTRPGKDYGVSGTLLDDGLFYCHTSSTCLKPQSACDAFEIYASYEFAGDKSKAAKHLLLVKK